MAESIEVQEEELSGSDLKHWANPAIESFEIKDSRFLLLDLKPKPFDRRTQALSRRVQDTERRLREWLNQNGHGNFLEKAETRFLNNNSFAARGTSLGNGGKPRKETVPAKPIPRDILKEAAGAMGLRPKFLFPVQSEELQGASCWPWGSHETVYLKIMSEAIREFFEPRKNPDAKKPEVVEFINRCMASAGLGNSDNVAEAMFTIIKPHDHDPRKRRD